MSTEITAALETINTASTREIGMESYSAMKAAMKALSQAMYANGYNGDEIAAIALKAVQELEDEG